MEITEISMIGDFEAGMKCLQNPSLISRFLSLPGIEKVPQVYGFWKWGALILALVATLSSIINRIKLLLIRVRRVKSFASSSEPLFQMLNDDYDCSEDDTCSLASSDDVEYESTSSSEDRKPVDEEDFCVAGSSFYYGDRRQQNDNLRLRRRPSSCDGFSWSDFAAGKSVVKLWDSFGLGLDFENSTGNVVSIWDLDKDQKISSIFGGRCQNAAVAMSSPAMVLTAEVNDSESFVLGAYDTRVGRRSPAIYAEWQQRQGKLVGINSGGVQKFYVEDSVTGALTVGDMRNVRTPLENLTESDGDTWWDADAVMGQD